MELRQTKLSKSAIINVHENYGRRFTEVYLFVSQLAAQSKYPIILKYKAQLTAIRTMMGYSDKKFRELMAEAKRVSLVYSEGDNLRLHSKTQDRKHFKTYKKNDYYNTSEPRQFADMVLIKHYANRQIALIRKKERQPHLGLHNSGNQSANYSVTASCKGISDYLGFNSTSKAKRLLDSFEANNLIKTHKKTEEITCKEFKHDLAVGKKNIRYDEASKVWYRILATEIEIKYNFKRIKAVIKESMTPHFDALPEYIQLAYLEQGYSIFQINSKLA